MPMTRANFAILDGKKKTTPGTKGLGNRSGNCSRADTILPFPNVAVPPYTEHGRTGTPNAPPNSVHG